jgi:DNA polymerase-3 subunit alpha
VLKETYGIFVYQEQVMEAAEVLAGYSLGEADLLRRAMGKKIQAKWTRSAPASSRAAPPMALAGPRRPNVRFDRQVRRLWLQQEPRRRLRFGRLSDRLG